MTNSGASNKKALVLFEQKLLYHNSQQVFAKMFE